MQHFGISGVKDKQWVLYPVFRRILTIRGESTRVVTNLQDSTTLLKTFLQFPPPPNDSHTPAPMKEVTRGTTLKPLPEKKILISEGTQTTSTDKKSD